MAAHTQLPNITSLVVSKTASEKQVADGSKTKDTEELTRRVPEYVPFLVNKAI